MTLDDGFYVCVFMIKRKIVIIIFYKGIIFNKNTCEYYENIWLAQFTAFILGSHSHDDTFQVISHFHLNCYKNLIKLGI